MRAIIGVILILSTLSTLAQGKKCDDSVLSTVYTNMNKLTAGEIKTFLSVFDESCRNNVEFSEFSNELLFTVLEKHTKKFLYTLEKQYPEIQLKSILNELESPVTDAVNLTDLIQKVEKINADEKIKKQVIDALQVSNHQ